MFAKNFDILATSLSILHNYFNSPTKLFLDLYLAEFLDTSTKSFFFFVYFSIIGLTNDGKTDNELRCA